MAHDKAEYGSTASSPDQYTATAGAYDLFLGSHRSEQVAALDKLRTKLRPEVGPVLDIGAGSGLNCEWLLTQVKGVEVVALEPSRAMRSLLLARVAAHPEWFGQITVRPEDLFSAPLPPQLGGALLLGVVGHFDAGERATMLAELAARLPDGGAALLDLQAPQTPARIEPFEFATATVGQLNYRGIGEGWPVDDTQMRWRMTYRTLDGERALVEDTAEFSYHHPSPHSVAVDAARVGLSLQRIDETTFWLLTREDPGPSAGPTESGTT